MDDEGTSSPIVRAGLPAAESVFGQDSFAAPSGRTYRVIATTERDEKDAPEIGATALSERAALAAAGGDDFAGTARKAAKLSIADAAVEAFADVKALLDDLPADSTMKALHISTDATSNRVQQEMRNVKIHGFLYAASREDDNDFHLIVGRDPADQPETYMTVEVSGLPPAGASSFGALNGARDAYKSFFGAHLPGGTYDFYDPPVEVEIEGSTFWDANHATGGRPGPQSLRPKMPKIWEVHPVTRIVFEPKP